MTIKKRLLAKPEYCAMLALPCVIAILSLAILGVPSPDWWIVAIPPLIFVLIIYVSLRTGKARMRTAVCMIDDNPSGFWRILYWYFGFYCLVTFLTPIAVLIRFIRFGGAQ
ncbi:MAG: hypothetical protein QM790_03380 [Nibricoccus sp.]